MSQQSITWDQYKTWIHTLVQKKYSFYCRGHANESWKLQTTFHRETKQNKIDLVQYLNAIIPEVKYHISAIRDEIIDLDNKDEFGAFLSLIQHHGFPTPLLDWTLSPYIAAYFAFREVKDQYPMSDNVKIYIFDYLEWEKSFQQPRDLRDINVRYISTLRPHARFNPRIVPQQGTFTVTNVDDMESYINGRSTEAKKIFLHTALLSVKDKPVVLRELNLMGINEMTLFPGFGGICRAMKSLFFSSDSIGPSRQEFMRNILKPKPETDSMSGQS